MQEIRSVHQSEAETFLQLLCSVFELDYARAHAIFFTEPLYDLSRKWALFEEGQIASILTTVPLTFGWGKAIGIAGVATEPSCQGRGLASALLEHVITQSKSFGETGVLLFAKDTRVYDRMGFRNLDEVVRGSISSIPEVQVPLDLDYSRVRQIYDEWATHDPNRLRRDDLRWKYWRWNMRICTPVSDGYFCIEGNSVREAVVSRPPNQWPMPGQLEWFGLRSMAERLDLRIKNEERELYLMGYNVPEIPQMFLTDQF